MGMRTLAALAANHADLVLPLDYREGRLESPIHPFVARCHELPHARLQAHGAALLALLALFLKDGWTFADGDPQNFAWRPSGPALLDWGAPVPRDPSNAPWQGLKQFAENVLYPLGISTRTGIPPSRWLRSFPGGIGAEETRAVLRGRIWRTPLWVQILLRGDRGARTGFAGSVRQAPTIGKAKGRDRSGDALPWLLRSLQKTINRLPAPEKQWRNRGWAPHQAAHSYGPEALAARNEAIVRIAVERRVSRVLDLGAHVGSLLATVINGRTPEHCVAVDVDPGCTHALHHAFQKRPVTLVEANLMEAEDLPDRLGAFAPDITLACGLIHHLALARSDGLHRALEVVLECAGKKPGSTLVLEWIPADDPQLRSLYDNRVFRSPRLHEYRLDAARAMLSESRSVAEIGLPGTGRTLLRCERAV